MPFVVSAKSNSAAWPEIIRRGEGGRTIDGFACHLGRRRTRPSPVMESLAAQAGVKLAAHSSSAARHRRCSDLIAGTVPLGTMTWGAPRSGRSARRRGAAGGNFVGYSARRNFR